MRISWMHDLFKETPEERKKIVGVYIEYGYECMNTNCYCRHKCKYCKGQRLHNLLVGIRRWFEYKLNIKIPALLYVSKRFTDLSGTTKCPFKVERRYSCVHCKYHGGFDDYMEGICTNKKYINDPMKYCQFGVGHCTLFQKAKWADNYDKKTGEMIYD